MYIGENAQTNVDYVYADSHINRGRKNRRESGYCIAEGEKVKRVSVARNENNNPLTKNIGGLGSRVIVIYLVLAVESCRRERRHVYGISMYKSLQKK
jgi:hypothetical protein